MPLVRRIRRRGANIVVEAHGEVLFAATGDVGRWTNRFSQRVGAFARQEAPSNKRPRWAHYGKPLKATITATTKYDEMRMRVYSAIGSSAAHAWYVDQGTGVFNGSGPYPAKILPPWTRGSASLYEHTWRPAGQAGTKRVRTVMIKGQKGQFFFDKALDRGFRSMRMRAFQVPGEGGPKISAALGSMPTGMENFSGNTPNSGAFRAELNQWREWRDAAWNNREGLGKNTYGGQGPRKPKSADKPKRPPKPSKPSKPSKPPKPTKLTPAQKGAIARQIGARLTSQGSQFRLLKVLDNGTWTALVKRPGQNIFKPVTGRWRKP